MKTIIKFTAFILFIWAVAFISCKKEKTVSPIVTPIATVTHIDTITIDTVNEREFIINNLRWVLDEDFDYPYNVLVSYTDSILFTPIHLLANVSIRLGSDTVWTNMPVSQSSLPGGGYTNSGDGYMYYYFPYKPGEGPSGAAYYGPGSGSLSVFSDSLNYQLVGTKVSLKVNF